MSYQFNPLSGNLERLEPSPPFYREEKTVDAAFLILPEIDLGVALIENSEIVFLNGLSVDSACYTITANLFLWNNSSELRENDNLFIRYNG